MVSWELLLGDCLEGMAALPDGSVDHVITAPPYSEAVHSGRDAHRGLSGGRLVSVPSFGFAHLSDAVREEAARQFARLARRWVIIFSDAESTHLWRDSCEAAGLQFKRTGVWDKIVVMPQISGDRPGVAVEMINIFHAPCAGKSRWNGGGRPGIWRCSPQDAAQGAKRVHPTQKPDGLMGALVADFTDRGDLVLDPFGGSGATGVAAIRAGRRFIGWERDPVFHAAAVARLRAAREQLSLFAQPEAP